MRRITLRQQTILFLSVGFTLIQVVTALVFTRLTYTLTEREVRTFLMNESTELVRDQFIIDNAGLRLSFDPQGNSVTDRLRKRGLSALVMTTDGRARNVFGIYRTFLTEGDDASRIAGIKEVRSASFDGFSHLTLTTGEQFETYTFPLAHDHEIIAYLQVAWEERSLIDILGSSIFILAALIPASILISILLSLWIVRRSLTPLESIVHAVQKIPDGVFPDRIADTTDSSNEYSILIAAINRLLASLSTIVTRHKEFVGNVAHELRTPLTKAMTTIDVTRVKDQRMTPISQSALTSIQEDLVGVKETISGLLSIARLYEEDSKNNTESNVISVVNAIVREHRVAIENKRLRIIKELPNECAIPMPPPIAKALLGNIIGNAVKYSRHDGEIHITSEATPHEVQVTISDTGIGMSRDVVAKMFDRRFRGTKSTPGHGVGMSLVKRISSIWHVAIDVRSKEGEGTTVIVKMKKK